MGCHTHLHRKICWNSFLFMDVVGGKGGMWKEQPWTLQCFHKHALGIKSLNLQRGVKMENPGEKWPINILHTWLHGSVSWNLSDNLLIYCPPTNSAAEIQQKGFTISAHSCYLRGPRWQMSLCYVSRSTLCLNNLFILNPFYITGVYTTVFKKRWSLQEENSIYKNFTFQQRDFKLLIMPPSTKITSKIIIYQKNKIEKKKNQCWRQQPYQFSCLLYLPTFYFCSSALLDLMASSATFPTARDQHNQ